MVQLKGTGPLPRNEFILPDQPTDSIGQLTHPEHPQSNCMAYRAQPTFYNPHYQAQDQSDDKTRQSGGNQPYNPSSIMLRIIKDIRQRKEKDRSEHGNTLSSQAIHQLLVPGHQTFCLLQQELEHQQGQDWKKPANSNIKTCTQSQRCWNLNSI